MLAAAGERATARGLAEPVACVRADVHALPAGLGGGGFDLVLCHGLLPYVDDARRTLAAALAPLRMTDRVSISLQGQRITRFAPFFIVMDHQDSASPGRPTPIGRLISYTR
ncbi:class I SAM-dependent methyltransferase [Streptomyces sp. NPDC059176]|uniref:class I SAM-dependent methyltransferase n=1 Tax=unclassified Streptomyces TaxID=2593676 RepID=UPI0036830092